MIGKICSQLVCAPEETQANEVVDALGNTVDMAQSLVLEVDVNNIKELINRQQWSN